MIVKSYKMGDLIPVSVKLTQEHLGFFSFKICNLQEQKETEACFDKWPILFKDGSSKHKVLAGVKDYELEIRLPVDLRCNHCVLRWVYIAGNSWGWCDKAQTKGALGCGDQEEFRSCSDISIL